MKKLLTIALILTSTIVLAEDSLFKYKDGSRVSYIPYESGHRCKNWKEIEKENRPLILNSQDSNKYLECIPDYNYISEEYICKKDECDFYFDKNNNLIAKYKDGKSEIVLEAKNDYKTEMPWVQRHIKKKKERIIQPAIELKNIYIEKFDEGFSVNIPSQSVEESGMACDSSNQFCFPTNGSLNFYKMNHVKGTIVETGEIKTAFLSCSDNGLYNIQTKKGAKYSMRTFGSGCEKRKSIMESIGL